MRRILLTCCLLASLVFSAGPSVGGELLIGAASVDITPPKPTALCGQLRTRIAHSVRSPLSATAVAIEARDGEKVIDQVVMVSIDTVAIRLNTQDLLRQRLDSCLPGFDLRKLFINATHTHTAPTLVPGRFIIPEEGVMTAVEYRDFMLDRVASAVVEAWSDREQGRAGGRLQAGRSDRRVDQRNVGEVVSA